MFKKKGGHTSNIEVLDCELFGIANTQWYPTVLLPELKVFAYAWSELQGHDKHCLPIPRAKRM